MLTAAVFCLAYVCPRLLEYSSIRQTNHTGSAGMLMFYHYIILLLFVDCLSIVLCVFSVHVLWTGGPAAETPSPMPMPLPSSQESTGSLAWGSQSDAPFSQCSSRGAVTPVPSSQGRQVTIVCIVVRLW